MIAALDGLKTHDRLLALAAEQSTVAIVLLHVDGPQIPIVLYANPAVEETTGYSADELVGQPVSILSGPDTDTSVFAAFRQTLVGGGAARARILQYRKDGTSYWADLSDKVIGKHPAGGLIVVSIRRDVDAEVMLLRAETDLRRSEQRYRTLFETNPVPMWIYDPETLCFLAVNERAVAAYGYSADEFASMTLSDVRPSEEVPHMLELMDRRRVKFHDHGVWKHKRKDGSLIDVHVCSADIDWLGRHARLALLRDVTQMVHAEAAVADYQSKLERSEKALAAAQSVAHIGSWDYDVVRQQAIWSDELYRIYGLERDAFGCRPGALWEFDHPDDVAEVRRKYDEACETGNPYSMIHRLVRPDGSVRWVHEIGQFEYDADGQAVREVGTIQDVTEKKEAEDRLAFLAHFDPLTGLPNRVLLRDRLDQSIARAARDGSLGAVLFLDLDHFKRVNDSLGHSAGDALLKEVATRLTSVMRQGDTVCRYSGDEFLIVINDLETLDSVADVATRMLASVAGPLVIDGREISTTASIGISVYPNDGGDMETLVKHADVAMYQAKTEGRSSFRFYQPAMQEAVVQRLSIHNELLRAVEREEFVIHYQPIVDLFTGKTVAAEALLRWDHPVRGLLQPDQFVSVAEESGLIVPIGRWVLDRACRDLAGWRETTGVEIDMHVNVAPPQFRRFHLIDDVADALRASNVSPNRLRLEITESLLMDNNLQALEIMTKLKSTGVQIELDDFGTGYSSLGRIGAFPIDGLKIDRSFVGKTVHDEYSRVIARAIIGLAKSLGLGIVAEGIETREQAELLKSFGCAHAQGYLFSRPIRADAFRSWLNRRSVRDFARRNGRASGRPPVDLSIGPVAVEL
jgi:diguanylate cyclase (GGDEF)-like protein/PAS domain S-box-containing protein